MGLFGSLFTGVSALFAQSQNTAIISNNIANISTTGFKRSEASFQSLVTTESRAARFTPGTVSVNRVQNVNQQGSIQQTASSTDASISGNGFFPVKRATTAGQEFLYTRAGQFSEDATGLLRNSSGFVLYAWPLDSNGNVPSNQGDLVSLVPTDVAFLGGLTRPTTTAELAFNLDADETEANTASLQGGVEVGTTGFSSLPVSPLQAANFSRGLTVFDTLGSAQTLTLEYRKVEGPMAKTRSESTIILDRSTTLSTLAGINAGDTFSITATGTPAQTYIIGAPAGAGQIRVDTVGDLTDQINDVYGGGGELDAQVTSSGQILIQSISLTDSLTVTDIVGTPMYGGLALALPGASGVPYTNHTFDGTLPQSVTNPYGSIALGPRNQLDFPDLANVVNPNTQGWWELKVIHPDGSTVSEGLLNFDGNGALNATADASGNIDINLTNLEWGNGSSLQDIDVDIARFSQFAGNYDVIFSDQNGAELGLRTGVELTRDGVVVAQFSNGASADLYKVPLLTFANENGLTEVSGTAYSESEDSGEENLREAGSGGAGFVEPSTLEASNVDLADEFARLIVAQRAFGAGTKVITTVDQMTEDLLRLR